MLSKELQDDPLGLFLIGESRISHVQLDTWLLSKSSIRAISESAAMRDGKPVSKGSFSRTLCQARENAHKAIYDVLILQYFGLIPSDMLERLAQIGNTLVMLRTGGVDYARLVEARNALERAMSSVG